MIDLPETIPSEPCSQCGKHVGHIHANLSRNKERLSNDGSDLETFVDVMSAKVLNSYCMTCGTEAARKDLEALGVGCREVAGDADTSLCACCEKTWISRREWHTTYVVAIDQFDEDCFTTLEEAVVAVACNGCEAKRVAL